MKNWKIEPVGVDELRPALTLLFAGDNVSDTRVQVEQALARITAGTADAKSLVWAVTQTLDRGRSAIGVCWIEGQAGNVGYLHPPVVNSSLVEREQCEQDLFVAAETAADTAGITWLQVLLDPGAETTELLRRLGLWHASTLVYQAALWPMLGREPAALRIRSLTYEANLRPQFEGVLAATYQGSMDCPALNGTRTVSEALQSYETIGQSGTLHWQLIYRDDTPIGCLLIAVHTPEQPATQLFGELIYWGVIPSARGQGFGREILELALWQARKLNLDKLVLAVDESNAPALRLYQQLGFFEWLRKEAWGKQVRGLTLQSKKTPSIPIFFHCNKLDSSTHSIAVSPLMKPKHLFHEIDKFFFFLQGLDSHQSGGFLSSIKETLSHPLPQRFDTPASMVRIASSGDTHRPPRTPQGGPETNFGTVPSMVIFGWSCPHFLRRRRARREGFTQQFPLLREYFQSSEPSAFATQHSARFAGSRSTIARVTNQCRK